MLRQAGRQLTNKRGLSSRIHDPRSSATFITVSYGNRLAEAQARTLAAPKRAAIKSEFVHGVESNPEYA